MTSRLNPWQSHFGTLKPLIDFGNFTEEGLERSLAELIKIRASQLNGCAFCLNMHTRDARKNGETEERLYLLDAWRETDLFSERERAALQWTETLTRISPDGASDEAYAALEAQFSEEEQVKITLLVTAINAFNRVNVGFRLEHRGSTSRKAA